MHMRPPTSLCAAGLAVSLLASVVQAEDKTKTKESELVDRVELRFRRALDECKTLQVRLLVEDSETASKSEIEGKLFNASELHGFAATVDVIDRCDVLASVRLNVLDIAAVERFQVSNELADFAGLPGVGVAENLISECGTYEYWEGLNSISRHGFGEVTQNVIVEGDFSTSYPEYGSVELLEDVDDCLRNVEQSFGDGVAHVSGTVPAAFMERGSRYGWRVINVDRLVDVDLTVTGLDGVLQEFTVKKKWFEQWEDGELVGRFPNTLPEGYKTSGDSYGTMFADVGVEGTLMVDGINVLEGLELYYSEFVQYGTDIKESTSSE